MNAARFILTRQAALALQDIHERSVKQWGQKAAACYIEKLYATMNKAATQPELGLLRQKQRAPPFLILPAEQHFIIYDRVKNDVVILALLHQRRDIEHVIADMKPACFAEIARLKKHKFNIAPQPPVPIHKSRQPKHFAKNPERLLRINAL